MRNFTKQSKFRGGGLHPPPRAVLFLNILVGRSSTFIVVLISFLLVAPTIVGAQAPGTAASTSDSTSNSTSVSNSNPTAVPTSDAKTNGRDFFEGRIIVEGRSYDQSLEGLRQYLTHAQGIDAKLYENLDPKLHALEARQLWGWRLAVAGPLIGAGLGLGGAVAFPSGSGATEQPSLGIFFGGVALGLLGGLSGFLIMPDFNDLDEFIDTHNRLAPNRLMRIEYGPPPSAHFPTPNSYSSAGVGFYTQNTVSQGDREGMYRVTLNLFF